MRAKHPFSAPRSAQKRLWRPGATLIGAVLCVVVLGAIGLSVERHLEPTSLRVPGTGSARGEALLREHFGDSSPFAILLRGPAAAIDRQGPGLVDALRRHPAATTISPWDRDAVAGLRPGRRRALILVDFHLPLSDAVRHTVPALERTLHAHVHLPVSATQSGFATISRALQEESLSATERAELLAAPLLILVLLAVFRSLVAAAIPLVLGAMTVLAGRGVLVLLSAFMRIDALSLVVCTMMGLALGVDYSLLIVSRFREELAAGREARRQGAPAPAPGARPPSPARPSSPRSSSLPSCSRAACSSPSPPRWSSSPPSASRSPLWPCRPCSPFSASESTPGGSARPRWGEDRGLPSSRRRCCGARR
jgi:putative drug exporter of the RND superfamily